MWDRTTRYGELASQLHAEICAGEFRPGDKLPSIRALCSRFKGSSATVTHALYLLEDAGLIAARPRSGFYVRERQAIVGQSSQPRPEVATQPHCQRNAPCYENSTGCTFTNSPCCLP